MLPEMKTEKTNIAKPGGITLPGFSYAHILNYKNGKNTKICRTSNLDFGKQSAYNKIIKTAKTEKIAELVKEAI